MNNETINTQLQAFITAAIREDVGPGDHTSNACIPEDHISQAQLLVKEPGILAGVEIARAFFEAYGGPELEFSVHKEDGDAVSVGDIAFIVKCRTRNLLKLERSVLNTMQRMSGIATQANRYKFEIEDMNTIILDTRKTTPLMRFLEKQAVVLGGCTNYRWGLYDRFMIKDNHVDACGGMSKALRKIRIYKAENDLQIPVTVEVRNLVELHQVLDEGHGIVDRILLDNFELPLLAEAVATIEDQFETEASGGITIYNIREYAKTGVQYISVGALTHSVESLDLSLKVI